MRMIGYLRIVANVVSVNRPLALLSALCCVVFCACGSMTVSPGSYGLSPVAKTTPGSPSSVEPSASPQPTFSTSMDSKGIVHSDAKSTGSFLINKSSADSAREGRKIVYAVRVEDSLGLDPEEVAKKIQETLDDDRGWAPIDKVSFRLVPDPDDAELIVTLATPATVNEFCRPLDTQSCWSCRAGEAVNLNADRWMYGTPSFSDLSIEEYRSYLVNHEIGHYLGRGHLSCPGQGIPAPVMQQQSMSVDVCKPNVWPANDPD